MDYEREIAELKRRLEDVESCCVDFRSCKGNMIARMDELEKKL